jgi:hypothetical protein
MSPEQIPGSLFVLLVALLATQYSNPGPILLALAIGCAFGWASYYPNSVVKTTTAIAALAFWALAFILALTKVF